MEETIEDYMIYVELKEILKYTDKSIKEKIPEKFLNKINSVNSNGYKFTYDINKELNEQDILQKTKELLSGLYIKYCCDELTAKRLTEKCKLNDEIAYKQYEIKWDKENSKQKKTENISKNVTATDLAVQKQGFFAKLLNKIKSIFKR